MFLIAEVLPHCTQEALLEAIVVYFVAHAVAVYPLALVFPEEEEALGGAARTQGKRQVTEENAQVTQCEDVVATTGGREEHRTQLCLQFKGHSDHEVEEVAQSGFFSTHHGLHQSKGNGVRNGERDKPSHLADQDAIQLRYSLLIVSFRASGNVNVAMW